MKEGEIHIETLQAGKTKTKSRSGCRCYMKNDMYHVIFKIDDDKCRITFDEEGMTYHRQGALEYELYLSSGREGSFQITTAYGTTEMQYHTHSYNMTSSTDEIMLNIKYNITEDDTEMKIIIKEQVETGSNSTDGRSE